MNDEEVRIRLRQYLEKRGCPYVEEVSLAYNRTRIDLVAQMDGFLVGFEIKSERDTLVRLQAQSRRYRRYFRRLILVGAEGHLEAAAATLPAWWGIWAVRMATSGAQIRRKTPPARPAQQNGRQRPDLLAFLMTKAELLQALDSAGLDVSLAGMRRRDLARRFAETHSIEQIEASAFKALWNRKRRQRGTLPFVETAH